MRADKVTAPGRPANTISASSAFTYSSLHGRHGVLASLVAPSPPRCLLQIPHRGCGFTHLCLHSCCSAVAACLFSLQHRLYWAAPVPEPFRTHRFHQKVAGKMGKVKVNGASTRPVSPAQPAADATWCPAGQRARLACVHGSCACVRSGTRCDDVMLHRAEVMRTPSQAAVGSVPGGHMFTFGSF